MKRTEAGREFKYMGCMVLDKGIDMVNCKKVVNGRRVVGKSKLVRRKK